MGTEVLRPQDLLGGERFRVPHAAAAAAAAFHRRRNNGGGNNLTNLVVNNNHQRKPSNNYYRKTSPRSDKRTTADNNNNNRSKPTSPKGQVTLLRRGESLNSLTSKISGSGKTGSTSPKPIKSSVQKPVDDLAVCGTGRLGPELPEMVPKQIRLVSKSAPVDTYAGSAFSLSPSPRSLPLPSFFSRKNDSSSSDDSEDAATRNLRRLLRLD